MLRRLSPLTVRPSGLPAAPGRRKRLLIEGALALLSLGLVALAGGWSLSPLPGPACAAEGPVLVTRLEGAVSPGTADFLLESLHRAADEDAECLIIYLDTPGGLDESTKEMVKAIQASPVPVVMFVAPSGARAASAGVFITLASHVAAMAPGTNIGAAHPVTMGGGEADEEMMKKVTNDAAARMRSIAQSRGRNVEWAERAVRESVSATAEEARALGVIDLVVADQAALLDSLEGREVEVAGEKRALAVAGREVREFQMGFRHRLMRLLGDPNVAYIFLILGFYGLLFELYNPGAILPGVVGGICLILAFFALQTLTVNWAGVLLLLFALVLFIAEIKIVSHGLLAVGGVVSFLLGSVLLFRRPSVTWPGVATGVSWTVIIPAVLVTVAFFLFAIGFSVRTHRRRPTTGCEGMVGLRGTALEPLAPGGTEGKVEVRGETWWAESDQPIARGEAIEVTGMAGPLRLKVRRLHGAGAQP